jgi:S1-C subfamily serine protease
MYSSVINIIILIRSTTINNLKLYVALIGFLFAIATPATAHESFAPIIDKVKESVVYIFVTIDPTSDTAKEGLEKQLPGGVPNEHELYEFYKHFFGSDAEREGESEPAPSLQAPGANGSGVIIHAKNGYVLTNSHVVADSSDIKVATHSGRIFSATVIGSDTESDVAVIKIDNPDNYELVEIDIGRSGNVRVGDQVLAIGSPFGLKHTVTSGIISGLGRTTDNSRFESHLQTDASINPGNSGGALVNMEGELIGINSMIYQLSGGSLGIGFAIPIDIAYSLAAQLINFRSVDRGLLGVLTVNVRDLSNASNEGAISESDMLQLVELLREHNGREMNGAVVVQLTPGSASEEFGMQMNDVIIEACGKKIRNSVDLRIAIGLQRPGQFCNIEILRNTGNSGILKPMTIYVVLGAREVKE